MTRVPRLHTGRLHTGREGGSILVVILSLLVLAGLSHASLVLASGEAAAGALGRERAALLLAAEGLRDQWMEAPDPFPGAGERLRLEGVTPGGRRLEVVLVGLAPGVGLVEVFAGPGARGPALARGVARRVDSAALASEARVAVVARVVVPWTLAVAGGVPCEGIPLRDAGSQGPAGLSLGPWPLEDLVLLGGPPPLPGGGAAADEGPEPPRIVGVRGVADLGGGPLRGIVAVEGDLILAGEGVVEGVVVVSGDVFLGPGARITGMLRAGGAVRGAEGAAVVGSPCLVRGLLDQLSAELESKRISGVLGGPA